MLDFLQSVFTRENLEPLAVALIFLNLLCFSLMGIDKLKARRQRRRIPEKVLFISAALFGGLGGTVGIYAFRHKTKHWYFTLFFPLFAILQAVAVAYFVLNC